MIKISIILISLAGSAYAFQAGPERVSMRTRGVSVPSQRALVSQRVSWDLKRETTALMSGSSEEDTGPEKKYVYAAGVVLFGILWDFFVTHGGQPYLAHPQ
jgi:hypothetical protein